MLIGGHRVVSIFTRPALNVISAWIRMESSVAASVAVPSQLAASSQAKRAVTPDAHQLTKRPRLDEDNKPIDIETQVAGPSYMNATPAAQRPKSNKPKKFKRPPPPEPGSSEDVILHDVMALVGVEAAEEAKNQNLDYASPLEKGTEIDLVVSGLSSNGMPFHAHDRIGALSSY